MTAIDNLRRTVRISGWWGFWSAVICGAASILFVSYASMQPSLTVTDVHELDGLAVRGGIIELVVTIDRKKECPADIQRWLWRPFVMPDGTEVVRWRWLRPVPTPPVPVGHDRYLLELPVPTDLSEGKWFYRGYARDNCGWLPGLFQGARRQSVDVPVFIGPPEATTKESAP